ncbi:MAG: phage tail protein [Chloroflexi bacterium]|nr:phage tail protein [Chloroflexota bacterium]
MTTDPLISSHFSLEVQGVSADFFSTASGFANTSEIVTHQAVSSTGVSIQQKIPGDLTWSEITLERGITNDMSLWDWRQEVINGNIDTARRDGSIVMYDGSLTEVARWNFVRGWPSAWTGPDVGADNQAVAIETITIAHEGLVRAL